MAEYYVEAPVTGKMVGVVEAGSEDEAIARFIETRWRCEVGLDKDEPHTREIEFDEVELHRQVNQGNVIYAPIGEASASLCE